MATDNRRVVFARINRREGQDTLQVRPFSEDLARMVESRTLTHIQHASPSHAQRRWFAADMRPTPTGDFMTGTLGYSEQQMHVQFDEESWSWIKGETRSDDAASEQTVVPFAVDLRNHERWVAFAPTARMRPAQFVSGFQRVLNEAALAARLVPVLWEVDLVTSRGRIDSWLLEHPGVYLFNRTVKFGNPGRDLDDVRAEMRALAANRKTEEFAASRGRTLNTESEEFRQKLEGTDLGNVDVILRSRGAGHQTKHVFNTRESADYTVVDDFGGSSQ